MKNRNIICYLLELGHRNFYYPTYTKAFLQNACEYEDMNWLGGTHRNLKAIKVKNDCLVPIMITKEKVSDVLFEDQNNYSIVWVEI